MPIKEPMLSSGESMGSLMADRTKVRFPFYCSVSLLFSTDVL